MREHGVDNIRKFFWVQLLSNANLLAPVVTLFYLSRGLDFAQIFSLLVIVVAAMLFGELPTGIVSDLYGRKTSFVFGQLLFMLSTFFLIVAQDYWVFALSSALVGVGITFFSGSDESFIHDSLAEGRDKGAMKKTMGYIWSAGYIPLIVAAPIGSFVAQDLNQQQFIWLLLGNLGLQLVALIIILFLKEPHRHKPVDHNPFRHFSEAFRHIRRQPKLLRLFVNKTLILIMGAWLWSQTWQPYFVESDVPVVLFGWVVSAGALLVFLAYRNMDRLEALISDKNLLFLTAVIPLSAYLIAAVFEQAVLAIVLYLLLKLSVDIRNPVFSEYFNHYIDSHNRATVLSALSVVDSAFDVVLLLTVGFIANISLGYAFLFGAAVIAVAIVLFPIGVAHLASDHKKGL